MKDFSAVFNADPGYIDQLYQQYLSNKETLDDSWKAFFNGFDFADKADGDLTGKLEKEFKVMALIHGFRDRGHLLSLTNPIRKRRDRHPHLDLADYGLSEQDLDQNFIAGGELNLPGASLRQILDKLRAIYCGSIGFEYNHINNKEKRMWLRDRIEKRAMEEDFGLSLDQKKRILQKLNEAVIFEEFLHKKYVGQKRFSLEGGETTIPALDALIESGVEQGVEEVIIGMAHRGRLNILANIVGKTYEQIFTEFEGTAVPDLSFGSGDVKYHQGYSSQVEVAGGKTVYLRLAPNPSHLEAVNPVVMGMARAKADVLYQSNYDRILSILIHGDAAIAGQGIVYETAQMSQLRGYYVGGTIHFVINNQIGFTTDFDDARTSTYSTSVATSIQAPVFHVNGDDPEAVIFCSELAAEYRQTFNTDVYIDMVCYRKHGHNESDEPKFTQPEMYKIISTHPNPRELYTQKLIARGEVQKDLAELMEKKFWDMLQDRLDMVKQKPLPYTYQEPDLAWKALTKSNDPRDFESSPVTGIEAGLRDQILNHLLNLPNGFQPLQQINRMLKSYRELTASGKLDWALAELLAYGSLLAEGKNVRISGQDVKRGTFSHRHAVVYDAETNAEYNRLTTLPGASGRFFIYNSLLSEFGVLGFEYGYSLTTPGHLVIWEAQFGDFYNGAQTMVDQFIASAESKWQRMSGLVLLLPHGYDGQGPEHSNARPERFLQVSADCNWCICNITTPANFFHALRRQLARPFRKPLIVLSPKSLLRDPFCVSSLDELSGQNQFREVIDDPAAEYAKKIKKVFFCTGQIYYELLRRRTEYKREDIALVRIEQLYPLSQSQVQALLEKYKKAKHYWVQEEPANMGAWSYMNLQLPGVFELISRPASPSVATGYKKVHDAQLVSLLERCFEQEKAG
ncbi:MAG TPA: 2-oxoglutarate dehydrogenase E1 component [Saprospiraceae bacterium]|nr:2-oxoglutarate dehydrogenase E1 component [Saprospiraceae bacterium]